MEIGFPYFMYMYFQRRFILFPVSLDEILEKKNKGKLIYNSSLMTSYLETLTVKSDLNAIPVRRLKG